MSSRPAIVVLGAGIIGLTTALCLVQSPLGTTHIIHVLADHWPDDPVDPKYASGIAGAHHLSFADDDDKRQTKWDMRTFQVMYNEWEDIGESTGLMALTQTEHYFMILDTPDVDHSISFTSLTMSPKTYLDYLLSQLRMHHVQLHRHHLSSLSDLSHPPCRAFFLSTPVAVIVCVGIGALTLGGVEDPTVFPTRGQVVKIHAPWLRAGYTRQVGSLQGGEGGERTYVIPRYNGEVIIGGTREMNDWHPYPRSETSTDILKRALELCPQLRPPHRSAGDPEIIDYLVGFRPSRTDGVRLERGPTVDVDGREIKVYYNYGHGGAGWQSCYGTAEDVTGMLLADLI